MLSFFDLVHDGKPRSDRLTLWERFFESYRQRAARAIEAFKTPPSPVQPALANDAYLGTYTNEYLGNVSVTASARGLVLQVGPNQMAFPLKHWHRDVFLAYVTPEVPDWPSPVTFTMGPDGKASQLLIEALNDTEQGVLTRAP